MADKKAEEYFQLYFPESENHLKNNLAGSIQIPVLTGLPAMSVQIRCPEQASALHGANRV
ncbi:MAG: hypothetical protein Q4C50_06980 [Eubacteriales bacterium]|nr:hypothetical protein [Eubacteriales bacterium]